MVSGFLLDDKFEKKINPKLVTSDFCCRLNTRPAACAKSWMIVNNLKKGAK